MGGEANAEVDAAGGGGGGDAALPLPEDGGDNQVTDGLLHDDTSLHTLVERGGGLRVTSSS